MKYRTAIIGCGRIAGGYDTAIPTEWSFTHAGAYHLFPKTELVGICDRDAFALKRFCQKWGNVACYQNPEEMLMQAQPQIVSICTPTEVHLENFKLVCKHDVRALFCEKPLSYDFDEAKQMGELLQERVVAVNYFRRWNQTFQSLRERITQGNYGLPQKVVAYYSKGFIHNASHSIDLLLWFFGPALSAQVTKCFWQDSHDAGINFSLSFGGGFSADLFHLQHLDYNFMEVDLIFSKGRVVLAQRGQEMIEYNVVSEPYYGQFSILKETERQETDWRHCMQSAVENIVACIENGGRPLCSMDEAFRTQEVCAALREQL